MQTLKVKSKQIGVSLSDKKLAEALDKEDVLFGFRQKFHYPKKKDLYNVDHSQIADNDEESTYLCGHSLGLMPKKTEVYVAREMDKWKKICVQGHMEGDLPWATSDEFLTESSAKLVGAKRNEVAILNGLTINQHLLLISFYQPTPQRYKILLEYQAFPSDHYCIQSQIRMHKLDPDECMVVVKPREGETTLRHEDIISKIEEEGSCIAVVLLSGVQYFTGQCFRMKEITKVAHAKGCYVGFDLAHAIGNVPMKLHDWDVDFACWCTYKYLCSGPGGIAGLYVHERYDGVDMPRLLGWWSHRLETRFKMDNVLDLTPGARAYRVSNPPGLLSACLLASLEIYDEATMFEFRRKSLLMSAYFEHLLTNNKYFDTSSRQSLTNGISNHTPTTTHPSTTTPIHPSTTTHNPIIRIITPSKPLERGCQFSITLSLPHLLLPLFKQLSAKGIVLDKREPSSLRFSFNPLYNRFCDIHHFVSTLEGCIEGLLLAG